MSQIIYSDPRHVQVHEHHGSSYCCDHCGKEYSVLHFLQKHERSACVLAKRNLTDLLEESKAHWESRKRKRRKRETDEETGEGSSPRPQEDDDTPNRHAPEPPVEPADLHIPIGVRKGKRPIHLPARYEHDSLPITPSALQDAVSHAASSSLLAFNNHAATTPVLALLPTLGGMHLKYWNLERVERLTLPSEEGRGESATQDNAETARLYLLETKRNLLGIVRRYTLPEGFKPTHDPDQLVFKRNPKRPDEAGDSRNPNDTRESTEAGDRRNSNDTRGFPETGDRQNPNGTRGSLGFGPFSSRTAFLLAEWYWQSSRKSLLDFQNLVSILKDPQFSLPDATCVDWRAAFNALGANKEDLPKDSGSWIHDDGWKTETISIDIPFHNRMPQRGIKPFSVGEFHYRSLVSVIKEKVSSAEDTPNFHYYPYEASWKPTGRSPEVKLYGELYTSRAFREAHEALQRQPRTKRDEGLERVVVALMFWSDATQLTAFGGASLWPCYMFFGNEPKHQRGEPSAKLGQQVAYFIKLPDRLGDFFKEQNKGRLPARALFKYLARELFHKQWSVLLNAEFIDAMKYGIVVMCPDDKERCFFPRILTYSCDYPEKTLVGGIRNNGGRPCHRCLVRKADLWKLGAPSDTERINQLRISSEQRKVAVKAQDLIRAGYALSNDKLECILGPQCLAPVQTAFSSIISEAHLPFDILGALVVDILHEFEIGVWKKLYVHLIRLLESLSRGRMAATLSAELNSRYRSVPPFARDTIRKFPLNVSEMKRKAARDYEDLLQCAIPTFEGLLPEEHNARLMELLFICAQWHALAKLRLHNDHTLELLDYTTVQLGAKMRTFCRDTCSKIPTKETKKEADARAKRTKPPASGAGNATAGSTRRPATLDVFTIKFHFLGDYSSTIRRVGTTDSFSTQTGELYHRVPKSWYPRTDRKDYETQLTRIERRQARLSAIRARLNTGSEGTSAPRVGLGESLLELERHYIMGENRNSPITLNALIDRSDWGVRDPYLVGFNEKLKRHLLPRILEKLGCAKAVVAAAANQWPHVVIKDGQIYSHQLLKVNYTTYDIRRDQDIIHVDTAQCNVMFLNPLYTSASRLTKHPYLYGKILGIYHADVCFVGHLPDGLKPSTAYHRLDVVWVNWYQFLPSKSEFSLDRVALHSPHLRPSVNFADPDNIIRGIHLIPQFSSKTKTPLPKSKFAGKENVAWSAYYINRFVDRDAFMRYQYGMSIGHAYMRYQYGMSIGHAYMRYQYGMSIGHAYMLTDAFPPPRVPKIPRDFDHCLVFKPGPTSTPHSASVTSIHQNPGQPSELRTNVNEQPSTSNLGDGRRVSHSPLQEREAQNCEGDDGDDDDDDGDDDESVRHSDGDEDSDDDDDDDQEEDYFDRMDDQELLQHDDMYGT